MGNVESRLQVLVEERNYALPRGGLIQVHTTRPLRDQRSARQEEGIEKEAGYLSHWQSIYGNAVDMF